MHVDNNKKLKITYNHLNLPSSIAVESTTLPGTFNSITYTYDAVGNKLKKQVRETLNTTDIKTSTTNYINGLVYETRVTMVSGSASPTDCQSQLQFIPHEEGRIRLKPQQGNLPASFIYDYMLKDHLGNIRMLLTEETQVDIYPAATMEGLPDYASSPHAVNVEKNYYNIFQGGGSVAHKSDAIGITDYENNNSPLQNNNPYSNTTALSEKLYNLRANGVGVTGLGITLRVMSGDRIDIFGKSYYFENTTNSQTQPLNLDGILSGLLNGPSASFIPGIKPGMNLELLNSNAITAGVFQDMLGDQHDINQPNGTKPRAYINYIVFDEQFNAVKFDFSQVGEANLLKEDHFQDLQDIAIEKNGFIYIYCSNQSPVDVFFDNLQVVHTRGRILEETHYYPFGLTMSGISSQAAGSLTNKFKFGGKELNNQEFSDGSSLDQYDFGKRNYDPQIGKWHTVDPLASKFPWQTPYCAMDNDPINKTDPTGMAASPIYGTDGNFLGTDDEGLKGNAIVMKKEDFTQGMNHADAIKKDLAPKGGDDFSKAIPDSKNYQKFYNHYSDLSKRPDYDGFVTSQEGIDWAKSHPNALKNPTADNTLYINTALLEFGNINTGDFAQTNEITPVNLLNFGNAASAALDNKLYSTIYALGRVNMILTNRMDRTVKIVNDEATDYDWNPGGGYIRNKLIMDERKKQELNDTHGFKTSYYGIGTLNWF